MLNSSSKASISPIAFSNYTEPGASPEQQCVAALKNDLYGQTI